MRIGKLRDEFQFWVQLRLRRSGDDGSGNTPPQKKTCFIFFCLALTSLGLQRLVNSWAAQLECSRNLAYASPALVQSFDGVFFLNRQANPDASLAPSDTLAGRFRRGLTSPYSFSTQLRFKLSDRR